MKRGINQSQLNSPFFALIIFSFASLYDSCTYYYFKLSALRIEGNLVHNTPRCC
jgi:hypothetical protein